MEWLLLGLADLVDSGDDEPPGGPQAPGLRRTTGPPAESSNPTGGSSRRRQRNQEFRERRSSSLSEAATPPPRSRGAAASPAATGRVGVNPGTDGLLPSSADGKAGSRSGQTTSPPTAPLPDSLAGGGVAGHSNRLLPLVNRGGAGGGHRHIHGRPLHRAAENIPRGSAGDMEAVGGRCLQSYFDASGSSCSQWPSLSLWPEGAVPLVVRARWEAISAAAGWLLWNHSGKGPVLIWAEPRASEYHFWEWRQERCHLGPATAGETAGRAECNPFILAGQWRYLGNQPSRVLPSLPSGTGLWSRGRLHFRI